VAVSLIERAEVIVDKEPPVLPLVVSSVRSEEIIGRPNSNSGDIGSFSTASPQTV
jgi:hypothetical protein